MNPNYVLTLYDNVVDVDKLTVSKDPAEPEWIVFAAKEAFKTSRVYLDSAKVDLLISWLRAWQAAQAPALQQGVGQR